MEAGVAAGERAGVGKGHSGIVMKIMSMCSPIDFPNKNFYELGKN